MIKFVELTGQQTQEQIVDTAINDARKPKPNGPPPAGAISGAPISATPIFPRSTRRRARARHGVSE